MKKRKNYLADGADEPCVDISSLIDVCFLLLIYFVVTSIVAPKEKDLPMTMPTGMGKAIEDVVIATIGVRPDGTILMNPGGAEELLDSDASRRATPRLQERLGMMHSMAQAGGQRVMVEIFAHDEV